MALPFQVNVWNIWLLVFAVYVGRFLKHNYWWLDPNGTFGESLPSPNEFQVYTHHDVLDYVLKQYPTELGNDYERYRHHCLRVLSFAVYQLRHDRQEQARKQRQLERRQQQEQEQQDAPQDIVETSKKESSSDAQVDEFPKEKETTASYKSPHNLGVVSESDVDLMAYALAYHDIALWTNGKLNYLDPSMEVMERDATQIIRDRTNEADTKFEETMDERIAQLFTTDESNLMTAREIILQHHKLTAWRPVQQSDSTTSDTAAVAAAQADVVNAVRKADWADATLGLIRYGLPGTYLEAAYAQVPSLGFHTMLLHMGSRLSPHSFIGQLNVLRILKW